MSKKKFLDDSGVNLIISTIKELISTAVSSKVDKASGKGLSTNDYTTAEKTKLSGISDSADAVSFSRSLTSGTKVGTITINGSDTELYAPTNTDTHYASKNVVGSKIATTNTSTALTNGNVYLNSVENGGVTSSHKISGSGATAVKTDAEGNILIESTNTTYSAAGTELGLVKSGGDVTISSGIITVNDDSHDHVISNVDGLQSALDEKASFSHTHTVDAALSSTSTNPVQNKVVKSALDEKVPTNRTINGKSLSGNITLSASDVGADTSGSANTALTNAKTYTDTKINQIVGEGASETLNTIGEISAAIEDNQEAIDLLNAAIGNKANNTTVDSHVGNKSNPHSVTKAQVGLENVDNTSDANKPVSTAMQTALNNKTNISVLPNDSGEIKTKYRISNKNYTNGNTWYFKLCDLPVNNDGNYASTIVSGRIGGWTSGNMSYINALVWNRDTPGIALSNIAGSASDMKNIWGIADLVLYTNGTSATAKNTATLYVKCTGYYVFDLDLELYQGTGSITYNGTYITSTPSGVLAAQASTSTKRMEIVNGKAIVNGQELSFASHTHDSRYYTESEIDSKVSTLQSSIDGKAALSHGTHVTYSTANPVVAGTATPGTATTVSRSDHVHPAQTSVSGSSGSCTGNSATATKLATARAIQTNLGSTSSVSFDGSKDIAPGVTGILPLANGGTGSSTAAGVLEKLGLTATAAELNYCDGVTSNIQTQIDSLNTKLTTVSDKISRNYKIEVGTCSVSVTQYTNKVVNFVSKPSGWTQITGVIGRPNFNPYDYSVDLEVMVDSGGGGCTAVVINPSITGTITFCYIIIGY